MRWRIRPFLPLVSRFSESQVGSETEAEKKSHTCMKRLILLIASLQRWKLLTPVFYFCGLLGEKPFEVCFTSDLLHQFHWSSPSQNLWLFLCLFQMINNSNNDNDTQLLLIEWLLGARPGGSIYIIFHPHEFIEWTLFFPSCRWVNLTEVKAFAQSCPGTKK